MGTTAEKLTYLNTTKQKIKDGLNDLGAGITDNDTFRSYANALADIYDELPKVTGTGTDLELTPTKKGKMKVDLKGNSSQESTTGYNIMNFDVENQNAKVTVNSDGTVTINGTGGFGLKFKEITLLAGETYKQKIEVVSGSLSAGSLGSSFMSFDSSTWLSTSVYVSTTLSADTTKTYVWLNANSTFDNLRIKIWGYKGTDNKGFERATDGPAPNPDYSYPVKTVTGENSIVIRTENLFDKNTALDNKEIANIHGGIGNKANWFVTDYILVKPQTTYSISGKANGNAILYYDINQTFLIGSSTGGTSRFTTPENAYYVRLNGLMTQKDTFMLVKGSTAPSTYIAHQSQTYPLSLGNIELNSSPDGTVRDEIIGTPDNWFKREYIGKFVLDGVNNKLTTKSTTNFNKMYFTDEINNIVVPSSNYNLGKGLSSHFKLNTAQNVYANDLIGFGIRTDNKINYGFGNSSDLTTLALANQWLQTQYNNGTPVTTCYLHVNYVDIPITDTTLISQLNNIYNNSHSCNGTTNITSTYATGNEQMVIEAGALKSWNDSNE